MERSCVFQSSGISVGDKIIVITWFHRARRDVLKVYPRSEAIDGTPVVDIKPVL